MWLAQTDLKVYTVEGFTNDIGHKYCGMPVCVLGRGDTCLKFTPSHHAKSLAQVGGRQTSLSAAGMLRAGPAVAFASIWGSPLLPSGLNHWRHPNKCALALPGSSCLLLKEQLEDSFPGSDCFSSPLRDHCLPRASGVNAPFAQSLWQEIYAERMNRILSVPASFTLFCFCYFSFCFQFFLAAQICWEVLGGNQGFY